MNKLLKICFGFMLFFVVLGTNVSAQESGVINDLIPDKRLQVLIRESLKEDINLEDNQEITKDMIENDLNHLSIDEKVKSLSGLEHAKSIQYIYLKTYVNKALVDVDFSPLNQFPVNQVYVSTDSQDGIDKYFLKDGDLAGLIEHLSKYSNITFNLGTLHLGKVVDINKDNYKQVKLNIKDLYKPLDPSSKIEFIFEGAVIFEFEDENEDVSSIRYGEISRDDENGWESISYDPITGDITLGLDEDASDPMTYEQIREGLKKNKFASRAVYVKQEDFIYDYNDTQIVIDGLDYSFGLKGDDVEEVNEGKVLVNHVDENNFSIATQEEINGEVGSNYVTYPKVIPGYELDVTPTNATGTIGENDTIVTYKYKRKASKVNVKYVDQVSNRDVADSIELNGSVGEAYVTTPAVVDNYELVSTPTNATGLYIDGGSTVIYKYKKLKSSVIVKYHDEDGLVIGDETKSTGDIGSAYNTSPKTIANYVLKTTPGNANGVYAQDDIEVIYVYKAKPIEIESTITIKHVDQDNNDIIDPVVVPGVVGSDYNTSAKVFDGYDLTTTPTNANGKYTQEPIVIIYKYTKKAPIKTKVIAKYVDTNNAKLAEDVIIEGEVGTNYITSAKSITGYDLTKLPENASGSYATNDIIVTYVYKKKDTVEYGQVKINYLDKKGNELIKSDLIKGVIGSEYSTHAKTIKGYTLKETKGKTKGKFTKDIVEVTYVYSKNNDKDKDKDKSKGKGKIVKTGSEAILIASILSLVGFSGYALNRKFK